MARETKTNFIEDKFMPAAAKVGSERHLLALRDGIVMVMPLLIIGAFSMIIAEFPFQPYLDFMARVFGENWNAFEGIIMNATYNIVALIASYGVASSLVNGYGVDGTPAGVIALSCFFITNIVGTFDTAGGVVEAWVTSNFSAEYLFTALLIALIVGEIYRVLVQKNITIKLPASVPPAVSRQFTALIPGIVIIIMFLIVRGLFSLTVWESFPAFVAAIIAAPLRGMGSSYIGTLLCTVFEQALWGVGLHGSSIIVYPIFEPIWLLNMQENLASAASHIVTMPFYESGVWIGGSGCTLPVVVYMLLFAKSKLLKQVGKIGIGPGIFNINEPVTFGLPIVLNPVLLVPFVLSPVAVMTVQYIGTAIGLFPLCNYMVPWTTPFFISGFLMTGSVMGVVAQIISFAIAFVIWLPFIRAWDKKNYEQEQLLEQANA